MQGCVFWSMAMSDEDNVKKNLFMLKRQFDDTGLMKLGQSRPHVSTCQSYGRIIGGRFPSKLLSHHVTSSSGSIIFPNVQLFDNIDKSCTLFLARRSCMGISHHLRFSFMLLVMGDTTGTEACSPRWWLTRSWHIHDRRDVWPCLGVVRDIEVQAAGRR